MKTDLLQRSETEPLELDASMSPWTSASFTSPYELPIESVRPRSSAPRTSPEVSRVRSVREDPRLGAIREKVERRERLTLEDGEALYATPDIWTVCELADLVRRRLHGSAAYYNINRHINYTNYCVLRCKFCSFYRSPDGKKMLFARSTGGGFMSNLYTHVMDVSSLNLGPANFKGVPGIKAPKK